MKKITIMRRGAPLTIEAPEGKSMVLNEAAMQQGVISLTEYGTSALKIAAFKEWDEMIVEEAKDAGYVFDEAMPF